MGKIFYILLVLLPLQSCCQHIDFLRSFGAADPDVEAYRLRVVAASGTLSQNDVALLDAFVLNLKTNSIWDKLDEVAPIMGGFNGCLVKLKAPSVGLYNLTNAGSTLFVSADYSETAGLTSSGNNKRLDTGFIPTDWGLSNTNIYAGVFGNGGGGVKLSDAQNPYVFDMQSATVRFANAAAIVALGQLAENKYIATSLSASSILVFNDYENRITPGWQSPPSMTLNNAFRIFHNGVSYSGGILGFYAIGETLTESEHTILTNAVNALMRGKGRLTTNRDCVVFGDSITNGSNASDPQTNSYAALISAHFGLRHTAMGIVGSLFNGNSGATYGGFNRRGDVMKYRITDGGKVIIMYGVNDITLGAGSASTFQTNLSTFVDELISAGVSTSNIIICTIPFITAGNSATKAAFRTAAQTVADNKNTMFADVWQWMEDNGGASLLAGDGVHPTTAGHAQIDLAIQAAIQL